MITILRGNKITIQALLKFPLFLEKLVHYFDKKVMPWDIFVEIDAVNQAHHSLDIIILVYIKV